MKQNDQKENRRDFLKNIGLGLFGISVLSNFSFENFLGSKALAKELPDFKKVKKILSTMAKNH